MTNAPPGGNERAALMNNSAALAERLGVSRFDLIVVEVVDFGRSMRRIVLEAPALADLAPRPGQDLMLSIATVAGTLVRRRYTIRHHEPSTSTVAIDIVIHGSGPGARWAADVRPGDQIEALGPRGVVSIDADADWHLFIGDESFFPAMSAMVEALPATVSATLICEAEEPADLPPIRGTRTAAPQLLTRTGAAGGARGLLAALNATELPGGRGRAYVGGELNVVAALKRALLARGLDESQVSAKAYWRAGAANANHGEPER